MGDGFFCRKLADRSSDAGGVEKRLHIERRESCFRSFGRTNDPCRYTSNCSRHHALE
jgi:hypothetical protein